MQLERGADMRERERERERERKRSVLLSGAVVNIVLETKMPIDDTQRARSLALGRMQPKRL